MKVSAGSCCDRPRLVQRRASTRCTNCNMRRGIQERPDLSGLELTPRELRAVEALCLLGGKAGVGAVADRARMMPREAGHLLASAGCVLTEERMAYGRTVRVWRLPVGVKP